MEGESLYRGGARSVGRGQDIDMTDNPLGALGMRSSVVQWHLLLLFFVAAPLKMVFPKKGSFFPGSLNN